MLPWFAQWYRPAVAVWTLGEPNHYVMWTEKKMGSANMKGGMAFVGTMCLRRDSRMAADISVL